MPAVIPTAPGDPGLPRDLVASARAVERLADALVDGAPREVLAEAVLGLVGVHAAFVAEHTTCFADMRTLREELAAAEERSRVAMDLHDDAVQRLFGVGLALQSASVSAMDSNPAVAAALGVAVDEIDAAIREIRTHVGVLRPPRITATGQEERRAVSPYRRQPRPVAPTRAS